MIFVPLKSLKPLIQRCSLKGKIKKYLDEKYKHGKIELIFSIIEPLGDHRGIFMFVFRDENNIEIKVLGVITNTQILFEEGIAH